MGAFNVNEFRTIYTLLDEQSSFMSSKSDKIMSVCEQLARVVNSTDSNLSQRYMAISGLINTAKEKYVSILKELESEMQIYAKATIENEEQANAGIKDIDSHLEQIVAAMNKLTGNRG